MVQKRTKTGKVNQRSVATNSVIPDVYREMLAEELPLQCTSPSKPPKRRRTEERIVAQNSESFSNQKEDEQLDKFGKDNVVETVKKCDTKDTISIGAQDRGKLKYSSIQEITPTSGISESSCFSSDSKPQQTSYRDFDEDSEISDCDWETIDIEHQNGILDSTSGKPGIEDLELTLTKNSATQEKLISSRKKLLTKADRLSRSAVHKLHILCLISYLEKRNEWCNDDEVQISLEPLLTSKILNLLRPSPKLSQFSRTQSLKRGLEELSTLWRAQFCITERGMRRALWTSNIENLKEFKIPEDTDSVQDKQSFRDAASSTKVKGSRDLGAQLFCALLRSAGVETRLVCSLQTLSICGAGPYRDSQASTHCSEVSSNRDSRETFPKKCSREYLKPSINENSTATYSSKADSSLELTHSIQEQRRRLGHPGAADYQMPEIKSPPMHPENMTKSKVIRESPYPVFWVEVFDESHQKWIPADPLVTKTVAKTRAFEPPASDRENCMSYVISFDKDGCARDVTRRYAKAYNGKTRKLRVECTDDGEKWWAKVMRLFSRGWSSDADQIEDTELASLEAREPMPKSISDFKGHPYFVLERHLRRNEALVDAQMCGTVASGRDHLSSNSRKTEKVYRRCDIKLVRSMDAWYRLGREVKLGEKPAKVVPSRRKSEICDGAIMPPVTLVDLFTEQQTEVYQAPPILNGRVPKNSFGNIDVFVPSMLPLGSAYLPLDIASRAAKIIGIDYAEALVGFEFRGRHGTAIFKGIVIAEEYEAAVRAVIESLEDEEKQSKEMIRTQAALKMWKRFILALRIKERIDSYKTEDEELDNSKHHELNKNINDQMNNNISRDFGHSYNLSSFDDAGGFQAT